MRRGGSASGAATQVARANRDSQGSGYGASVREFVPKRVRLTAHHLRPVLKRELLDRTGEPLYERR
jgi:hypothetical protein